MSVKDDRTDTISRRQLLQRLAGAGLSLPLLKSLQPIALAQQNASTDCNLPLPAPSALTAADDPLLDQIEEACFCYFWEQASPQTGLVKDRSNVRVADNGTVASIAATGFGLTALCIADKRGFMPSSAIQDRVVKTLRFLWKKLPTHRGFFFHFANINTGERVWDSEISSVDTAILLCGLLTCRQYFPPHSEISLLSYEIFNRVDWTWLSEDTSLLPHGWAPEQGFLPYRWDYYSELMMMYLLGLGSLAHPLNGQTWHAWKRTTFEYDGLRYIGSFAPLFIHQYSQAWFDFRHKRDQYADYFHNSVIATEVHRRFCVELSKEFPNYNDDLWGITASDSQKGYVVWGGPPQIGPIDGSIVPSAAAGSLPFMPQPVMRVLHNIRNNYGVAWSQYGFVNAFNPLKNWYDTDVIGIDTGITMLMAENARTAFVWQYFMKNLEATRGMDRAGFKLYYQPGPAQQAKAQPPHGASTCGSQRGE